MIAWIRVVLRFFFFNYAVFVVLYSDVKRDLLDSPKTSANTLGETSTDY